MITALEWKVDMDEEPDTPLFAAAPRAGASVRRPMLGDLLIREGLITEADLKQALDIQATLPDYTPLGQVLVDRGVLTQEALHVVLRRYHKKDRLGDILIETNVISDEQLERALDHQRRTGGRLGDALIELDLASEEQVRRALCGQLEIAFVDLDQVTMDGGLRRLVGRSYAERHRVLPLIQVGDRLIVALDDPSDQQVIQDLRVSTGCTIEVVTGISAAFDRAFARLYEEGPRRSGHFLAALEQAEQEQSRQQETERAFVTETQKALAELGEVHERLRELEHRAAEIGRLLAGIRAEGEDLSRENRDALARVQALEARQDQIMETATQLEVGLEALRHDHEVTRGVVYELRGRCQGLLDERHAMVAAIESVVSRLKNGGSL